MVVSANDQQRRLDLLGPLPDLAERIAIDSLRSLCEHIGHFYKPGGRITICSDGHVFGDLVSVSDEEISSVQAVLDAGTKATWFVGAIQQPSSPTSSENWLWITGELLDGTVWATNEPNDQVEPENNEENIGSLIKGRDGVVDANAGLSYPAVCECDGRPVDPVASAYLGS